MSAHDHLKTRKWYQMLLSLEEDTNFSEVIKFIVENIQLLVTKCHCPTLFSLICKLCDKKLENTLNLLEVTKDALENIQMRNDEQEEMLMGIRINIDILTMKNINLYVYKKYRFSKLIQARLDRLSFLYYREIGEYFQAYQALTNFSTDENILAHFAVLSDDVFTFEYHPTGRLASFVELLSKSDVVGAREWLKNNSDYFGDETERVVQKVNLISLVELCTGRNEVNFMEISDSVKLNVNEVFLLVLTALGRGLIRGHIDGEKKSLFIKSVVSRIASNEEILRMKCKFNSWGAKIREVIKTVGE